ncbi:hypothetical protein BJ322DRAFT_886393 [Thelephora terrestris]|uniref:Uncharacterized protein n=1 Tax=Thelephora terrestris TaxID=56493 RepID=A0A9P6L5T2_9AGAM|nr:hypothetical protein BJ322DRAFT_886393 [Thelephora terrestris]
MDRLLVQSYVVREPTTLRYCTATRKYARSISVFKSVPTHLLGCTLPFSRDTGRYSRHLGIRLHFPGQLENKGQTGIRAPPLQNTCQSEGKIDGPLDGRLPIPTVPSGDRNDQDRHQLLSNLSINREHSEGHGRRHPCHPVSHEIAGDHKALGKWIRCLNPCAWAWVSEVNHFWCGRAPNSWLEASPSAAANGLQFVGFHRSSTSPGWGEKPKYNPQIASATHDPLQPMPCTLWALC